MFPLKLSKNKWSVALPSRLLARTQKQGKAAGAAEPSYLTFHLNKVSEDKATPDELEDIKATAATIYGAGADTVNTSDI